MAMKKAEMEDQYRQYHALMNDAHAAEYRGMYRDAVKFALMSWKYIDGMMQYARRYENREFDSVEAIDLILKYAPLLLDTAILDRLEILLKDFKRIERNTSENLTQKLSDARAKLWESHRLWSHLEWHSDMRQDDLRAELGGNQDYWRSVAEAWEKMGLLRRTPEDRSYRLSMLTRMGAVVGGKCPSCGKIVQAPKSMLLESMTCPACRCSVVFVILSSDSPSGVEG